MIPFEERFTAWVDGKLTGKALDAFEKEMSAHPEAAEEKAGALKLGALLRAHPAAPHLSNTDFFNRQLLQRIAAETPAEMKARCRPETAGSFWSFQRLILAGGMSLAIAFGLYTMMIPAKSDYSVKVVSNSVPDYLVEEVRNTVSDPNTFATTLQDKGVTVVWLDGLESVPANFAR